MKAKRHEEHVVFYAPIPTHPDHDQNYVVVLPSYPRRRTHHNLRCCLGVSAVIFLLAITAYLLYPSDPDLALVRLHVNKIQVQPSPYPSLDLSLSLSLKVFNRDFFYLDYSSIVVSIGYRGRELGFVTSDGGHVRARGSVVR
ncbi:hypothetical protein F0562_009528 [Nyssa sinensis]|uniref:Late embryogenesis abundant protein LEA-2 subgroup domain-containing protein n=1 Tax=Nyssa sinensis TaxID=561372 RepID=A0A5J4ZWG1_9ASTE|nr:hypothetical protein F0562_009528 [Nyssa sinensis]